MAMIEKVNTTAQLEQQLKPETAAMTDCIIHEVFQNFSRRNNVLNNAIYAGHCKM